jgi:DNA-binding LacI/PurR family transcriptional regulator
MVACLIRRLEHWTQVGREIMLGVDETCGELERAMLLVHDRVLFRQTHPTAQSSSGSDREIRQSMEDFLLLHSERIRGIVLDELWPERVLARFKKRIQQGVVLYRSTNLPFLGCVSADVQSAARMVINHAAQNQFAKLSILLPFRGYAPSEEMLDALQAAANGPFGKAPVVTLDSSSALDGLIAGLHKERHKTLLVATEDNSAVAVLDALRQAGMDVPGRVGLVTTMGSRIALDLSMTSAGFDFRLMGSEAARMAINGPLQHLKLPAIFSSGSTA